jgi:hypothetical protein
MNAQTIADLVNRAGKDSGEFEWSLCCINEMLGRMNESSIVILIVDILEELPGYADNHFLVTILELIEGHLILRSLNP